MTERLLRRLQLFRYAALAILVIAGGLAHGESRAYAVSPQPVTAWSFYVRTSNVATIGTLGCNQGHADAASRQNSEVILDFGVQWSDNSKTLTKNGIYLSIATVEQMAESFVDNYYTCTGADTTTIVKLGIGTNNSTGYESSSMGSGWAQVAVDVKNWLAANCCSSQYNVVGANDIEAAAAFSGSGSQPRAINWGNGFNSHGGAVYVNYGSADGCPPYTTPPNCVNGWTQDGVWIVSWGIPAAYALPEIYYLKPLGPGDTKGGQPAQWAQISLWGKNQHSGSMIIFEGPLDEHDLDGNTLDSPAAWTDFWNALSAAGVTTTMYYSAQIHDSATN